MGLLAPAFLLGLAAIAVPVALHLVRQRERSGRPFPSLMFLHRIPHKSRRRRQLRDPALLALRCLALALVALAFAGPHVYSEIADAAGSAPERDRVFLLDRSYSMAYPGRWSNALDVLRQDIGSMASGQRAAIVVFDQRPHLVRDLTDQQGPLLRALDDLTPGTGTTDYAAGLAGAARLLDDSIARHREIVLISDLQRTGLSHVHSPALAEDIELALRPVPPHAGPNAAVVSAELMPARAGDTRHTLTVRLRNTGAKPAHGVSVTTLLEGHEAHAGSIDLAANAAHTLMVPMVIPDDRTVRLHVRLDAEGLATDDAFYLVSAREQRPAVLVVTPRPGGDHSGLFIRQALALASAPAFDMSVVSAGGLDPSSLSDVDVVVLDDVPFPGSTLGQALSYFVARGGGLLVVAADTARDYWPGAGSGYLPGRPGPVVQRVQEIGRVFETRQALTLPDGLRGTFAAAFDDVDVTRYRKLETTGSDRVLARFDDGAPALAGSQYGDGRVLVITTTLDPRWSTLHSAPGFAPFLIEIVRHLADRTRTVPGLQVGTRFDLLRHGGALPGGQMIRKYLTDRGGIVVEAPATEPVRLGPEAALYTPQQPGFHVFHPVDANAAAVPVAVNVNPIESNPATLDIPTFMQSIQRTARGTAADSATVPSRRSDELRGNLWWYVLALAGMVLALEAWLANRLSGHGGAIEGRPATGSEAA